jgi:alanyl aminopeptidase
VLSPARYTRRVRAVLCLAAVLACSSREPKVSEPPRPVPRDAAATGDARVVDGAPGLRLPAGVTPLGYDLRLELDPEHETFSGHVAIRVKLDAPAARIWLHADELAITSARASVPLVVGPATEHEMISLTASAPLTGEITLQIDYTGRVGEELEGLFRQKLGGKWFLYSQAEATYARRILPCFDEPRFKVPWRVTLVVPAGQVALANAPVEAERDVAGKHEVVFKEAKLPAHLFAVAVGPFELVTIGPLGKNRVPARIAVAARDVKRTAAAATWTPKLVDALEQYFDEPLPLAKLDLVAVPRFFGAMENPGLITFEHTALLGSDDEPVFVRRLVRFLSHELAHQWVGNAVTPAWWNDLWLAEAFATWLDDKLSSLAPGDPALRTQLARAHAMAADREVTAQPLRRPIATNDDIEDAFDAISYEKGAAVIAMFEQYIGEAKFRDVMRAYIRGGGSATAEDFVTALGRVDASAAKAFAGYLGHAGAPVVDMKLDCAKVIATPRDNTVVPVCVRAATGKHCALASGPTTIDLGISQCNPWVIGNDDGRGYYYVQWAARPGAAKPTTAELLAQGEDRAGAVSRGELARKAALAEIDALLATTSDVRELAALPMTIELDKRTAERDLAAWGQFLATRYAARLSRAAIWQPKGPIEYAIREALVELVPPARFPKPTAQRAREVVDRALDKGATSVRASELVLAIALASPAGKPLFEKIVDVAAKEPVFAQDDLFEGLAYFDASLAPRAVELVLDKRFAADHAWGVIGGMLARTQTRAAAWHAVKARLGEILSTLGAHDSTRVIEAMAGLCGFHEEVAAAFAPHLDAIPEGQRLLARALASIDKCVATSSAAPTGPAGP